MVKLIASVKGTVESVYENAVVIECNNIGYLIQASAATLSDLSSMGRAEVKIHTLTLVREDSVSLVGFLSKDDLHVFELLTSVSGVGAKAALAMQSALSSSQIMLAILTDDTAALSKAQGIGKKIAQRIAMELKDKVKTDGAMKDMSISPQQSFTMGTGGAKQDAVEALTALGYGRSEAVKTVLEVALAEMTTEQIIKLALKKLSS